MQTKRSAVAEGPRDALRHFKSCWLNLGYMTVGKESRVKCRKVESEEVVDGMHMKVAKNECLQSFMYVF